jgi:hypothetical protein
LNYRERERLLEFESALMGEQSFELEEASALSRGRRAPARWRRTGFLLPELGWQWGRAMIGWARRLAGQTTPPTRKRKFFLACERRLKASWKAGPVMAEPS